MIAPGTTHGASGGDAEGSGSRDAVEVLVEEFFERRRRGDLSDVDEFASRVPGREAEFKELVETLTTLESAVERAGAAPSASSSEASSAEAPRARLGRFRLLRLIGRGGMGAVFEAVDDELSRHVALKILPGHATLEERELARFRREAQAAARLSHPHIVPVFGVGEDDGAHWLAMQYIPGESLEHVLRRGRAPAHSGAVMSPRDVARHGLAIAEALACAHAEGVLHRDVKPSNLLLDTSGVVWITDFGLAKSEGTATITRTGETVGTPRYMAPEAFSGWADPRTDVWGVGATLYELLAGKPAFDGGDRAQLLKQIHAVEPTPLRRLEPSIPRDLATIVHKCLQKEPAARYATAQELADDLRRFLAGEPIRARPPSLAYRVGLVARRHRPGTIAAGVGLFVVVGLLVAWNATLARTNRRLGEEKSRAEANLAIASESIERLMQEVATGSLWHDPEPDPIRRRIFQAALEYELRLLGLQQQDAGKQLDVSIAHVRVAELDANLGRLEDAESHCAQATTILQALLVPRPDSRLALLTLAEAVDVQVALALQRGTGALAATLCRENLDRLKRLVDEDPADLRSARSFVDAASRLCDLLTQDRRPEEGARILRETLLRMSPVLEAAERRESVTALRNAWFFLANAEAALVGAAAALPSYERALKFAELLAAEEDSALVEQEIAASVRVSVGEALRAAGRIEEAAAILARAHDELEAFVQRDPTKAGFLSDLAGCLGDLAHFEHVRDPLADCESTLRRAVALADRAVVEMPGTLPYLSVALQLRADLGTQLHDLGRDPEALAILVEGTEQAERALRDHSSWFEELVLMSATLWLDRGIVELALADPAGAESSQHRALEILEWVLEGDRVDVGGSPLMARALTELGWLAVAAGRLDEATARLREAQRIARSLVQTESSPLETSVKSVSKSPVVLDLVTSLNLDGNVCARQDDLAGAEARLDEAVAIASLLAAAWPAQPRYQAALGTALADRARMFVLREDEPRAHAEFLRALPLLADAARRDPWMASTRHALAIALDWLATSTNRPDDEHAPAALEAIVATAIAAGDSAPSDPEVQFFTARVLSRAADEKYGRGDTLLGAPSRHPWADLAMERLRAASGAGWADLSRFEWDNAFDPLRPRADFAAWLEELRAAPAR